MKKLLATVVILLVLLVGGYWGWNYYALWEIDRSLQESDSGLTDSASPDDLLSSIDSIPSIFNKAKKSRMPFFKPRYSASADTCTTLLRDCPRKVTDWIEAKRSRDWLPVGSEMRVKSRVDDKALIATVRSLKETCNTGLSAQDKIAQATVEMEITADSVQGMRELATEIKRTARQAQDLARVGQEVAEIKGRVRKTIQEGLRLIDRANRKIERYAEVSTLRQVCVDWKVAQNIIESARGELHTVRLNDYPNAYQDDLALALVRSDQEKISKIISKISPHVSRAEAELRKAQRQESTFGGRAERHVGRFIDKAKRKVSQSRIGRELAVSFKTLVLGTKMFYDLMDMDSGGDIMSWALSYEDDMNQLMEEMDEIQSMEGWSLTGKNTFVEDIVDSQYKKSFGR